MESIPRVRNVMSETVFWNYKCGCKALSFKHIWTFSSFGFFLDILSMLSEYIGYHAWDLLGNFTVPPLDLVEFYRFHQIPLNSEKPHFFSFAEINCTGFHKIPLILFGSIWIWLGLVRFHYLWLLHPS